MLEAQRDMVITELTSIIIFMSEKDIFPQEFISGFNTFPTITLLHEKFLQFDWLRGVVFQVNLK